MSGLQALKIATLAGVCMLSLMAAARAQDNSGNDTAVSLGDVTFGVTGVTQSSAAYGRYNGMPTSGVGAIAGWNLHTQDAWNSGGTHYFSSTGDNANVGFGKFGPEATVTVKVGEQGLWGLSASYDAMTYAASNNFTTILDTHGNLSQGYQNALIGANAYFTNTATNPSTLFGAFNASTHLATANPITAFGPGNEVVDHIGTRRDKATLDGNYETGDWVLTSGITHEHKEGTLEQTMTVAGSNAGMVTFPMPVNYDTDLYRASATYSTDDMQAIFSYEFSNFIDHNSGGYVFQGWDFTAFNNTTAKTFTSYARSGDYSLPPSNQAHTFTGQIVYDLDPTTRVVGTMVYGLQMQNAPFVPATELGYLASAAGSSLAAQLATNSTSLNGLVETFFGNVVATFQPMAHLDLKASYKIDARSPQTKPMSIYGDPTDTTALKLRIAVPASWTKQEVSLTASYHILPETQVTLGYTFRDAQRSNAITRLAQDNEASAKIHSNLGAGWTGSLDYLHADRTASAPDFSLWLVQISSDCGATLVTLGCQQIPFYEAARTQDSVNGTLTGMINERTSLTLFGKYNNDAYHDPAAVYQAATTKPITTNPSVGINHDYSIQAGPDVNYQIDQSDDVHFYYTFLRNFRDMRALNNQTNTAGGNFYEVASTYDIHTGGIGGTWQVDDALKVVGDYTLSYGGEAFAQSGTWALGDQGDPLLNTKSVDNQFKVHAVYEYSPRTTLYFGYQFDTVDTNNWALLGASVGQVLTGDLPPRYNVGRITAALTMKL